MNFFKGIINNYEYGMRNSYITTTFKDLDDAIGGFTQASLVTIAGLPGARGENFIYTMLCNWVSCEEISSLLYINLKGYDYSHILFRNISSILLNYPYDKLLHKYKWSRTEYQYFDARLTAEIDTKEGKLSGFYTETFSCLNINSLCTLMKEYVQEKNVKVIVIDDLHYILGEPLLDTEKQKHHIAKRLKQLSLELSIAIVVSTPLFVHYDKDSQEASHLPNINDFRCDKFVGDIDYFSDIVLGVHSPKVYDSTNTEEKEFIEINVLKNIFGKEGDIIKLYYDKVTRGVYPNLNTNIDAIKLDTTNYKEHLPIKDILVCIYYDNWKCLEIVTGNKQVYFMDASESGLNREIIIEILPFMRNVSFPESGSYYVSRNEEEFVGCIHVEGGACVIFNDDDVMSLFESNLHDRRKKEKAGLCNYETLYFVFEHFDALLKAKRYSLINKVKQFSAKGWSLGVCHGVSHWERVERNGLLLATEQVNTTVVRLFAYLHDKWRVDNWEDLEHGKRAAENLPALRGTLLAWLTDEEFALLCKACELHTVCHRTGNPTIDACFDADRLDLMRVGIIPDPKKMATERGAFYAANMEQFYADTKINDEDLPF